MKFGHFGGKNRKIQNFQNFSKMLIFELILTKLQKNRFSQVKMALPKRWVMGGVTIFSLFFTFKHFYEV